jgi:hypothetical protein
LKQQDCPVNRIGHDTAENQFASCMGPPREREGLDTERLSPFQIIRGIVVKQQVMHLFS